ncbi:MAG TPA: type II toxin-antitoxin system VapC family toxin [Gemmatimonadaceae bacterium]
MILDTSAILALLWSEPESSRLLAAIEADLDRRMSAASVVESGIVVQARHGDAGERELDVLLNRMAIEVVPVTEEQAELARSAFRRYGKGRHAAGLNYGDCFSYALAMVADEPLLFTGDDFARTDVRVA